MAEGYEYKGQPIIISEFGGIAFSGGGKDDWGYGHTVSDAGRIPGSFRQDHDRDQEAAVRGGLLLHAGI